MNGPREVHVREQVKPGHDECVYITLTIPPVFHALEGSSLFSSSTFPVSVGSWGLMPKDALVSFTWQTVGVTTVWVNS